MPTDERRNLTPDDETENVEELVEDLDVREGEAANVKGGGPRDQTTQTGGGPEDLR